jgi:DNA-binding transcriptional LysR family regulator
MNSSRNVLTPDALSMLQTVQSAGSFAAAARTLGLVPSALTYRVRQIEDALDVLLFDRSSRQAKLTAAGEELLREGTRLLADMDSIANRVKRIATGWESEFTLAVDAILDERTVMELCEAFLNLKAPTRLRLRNETLMGTLEALTSGQADLALGVANMPASNGATLRLQSQSIGSVRFVFAISPHHPLANAPEPLSDAIIGQHRAIAVADSTPSGNAMSVGLLAGQEVFTVPTMNAKIDAQARGLGVGFLPESKIQSLLGQGFLVSKIVSRPTRLAQLSYVWRAPARQQEPLGRALQWWLKQLESQTTRSALMAH